HPQSDGDRPMSTHSQAQTSQPQSQTQAQTSQPQPPAQARPLALRPATGARRRVTAGPTVVLSALVLLLALAWALAPELFTSFSPTASAGPSLQAPSGDHWFGTDATGRDVFSRVVHGASHSITAAIVAVTVGLVVGTTIGVIAGAVGGLV